MFDIDELDEKFGIEGELGFIEADGDLVAISIFNKYADAEISLYGAQVTRFMPHGSFDLLWMSPDSFFEEGKAIRGGIPLCFPWFGPDTTNQNLPAHGFARLMYWDIAETAALATGETVVKLRLKSSPETKKYWPFDFNAEVVVTVGNKLDVKLTIYNTDKQLFNYTAALHSYFNVSGIDNIKLNGLQGVNYHPGFGPELMVQEEEFLVIEKEENRRYINTNNDVVIIDEAFNQAIRVAKTGSNVTVVWNPWDETAAKFEDMPDDGFETFICVEAANFYNDQIVLAPGESHTTSTTIGLDYGLKDMKFGGKGSDFTIV